MLKMEQGVGDFARKERQAALRESTTRVPRSPRSLSQRSTASKAFADSSSGGRERQAVAVRVAPRQRRALVGNIARTGLAAIGALHLARGAAGVAGVLALKLVRVNVPRGGRHHR